ncbi:hypothetical protein CRP01_07880 [Flavilitoribacter nigricans DSM 23189 = NBRC 102662]|uniref:Asl1-like glycosyl hydrolase catalytic domain-containing protein n=2 Tax=Flavilitoribacter TaxID=2762562 RepID=A0A2D0NFE8_FLAN2|nr:hypothetical protein CRP01_07880 [Flavilitoribacter nigricans DSM 23189 = NBRC 102662]
MTYRYLTVLCMWALFGAFVCQYESDAPDTSLQTTGETDDRVSRRDLAWSMRQSKELHIVFPTFQTGQPNPYREIAEKLAGAFPKDWKVTTQSEDAISAEDLRNSPLVLLGREFQQSDILQLLEQLPFEEAADHFRFHEETYDQDTDSYRLFLYPNPNSRTPVFLIGGNSSDAILAQLSTQEGEDWSNIFWRSWGYEIYDGTDVLVRGNFRDRDWTFEPDNHFDFTRREVVNFNSEHFRFHDLSGLGKTYIENLAAACEAQLEELRAFTGSSRKVPVIDYYIYPTIEEKGLRLMNTEEGHLVQEHREIHVVINETFLGQHTHQDIKLILHDLLGPASKPFLREGLAAFFNEHWQEKGADHWAARLYHSDNLPDLEELLNDERFERESPLVMTATAGSLISFLVKDWGREKVLEQYGQWDELATEQVRELAKKWHQYLAAMPAPAAASTASGLPYYRGFNFAHEGYQIYNGYGSALAQQSLEKLSQLGTNAIAIVPYGFQRDPQRAAFLGVHHGAGGENDESVIYSHAQAQALGMYTLLKPQLWVSGSWPGDVNMQSEAEWTAFFDYYHRWIRHYALMAEMRKFDAFCLGVEFSKATLSHPEAWRELIRKIRGLYSGPLTYAANWGEEFEQLAFWNELDFIGLNCYYPLSKDDQPSKNELRRNFSDILEKAEKVSRKFNKPLVFTEVGFRSVAHTWKNPHAEADGRPYDPECQRVCYEVLFEGIEDKKWVNGLFIWKWPSYLDYQERNPVSFTPSGKPAELVVQQWFENKLGR